MPTQEERLTTLEQNVTTFQRETVRRVREIQENATITLGIVQAQGIDIKKIYSRLEMMDERLGFMDERLGSVDERLSSIEQRMETKFDEHARLLTQILERLPK